MNNLPDNQTIKRIVEKWAPLLKDLDAKQQELTALLLQNMYDRAEAQKTPLQKFAERACEDG